MKKINIELRRTETPEVCVLPRIIVLRVQDFLDENKIEYKVVDRDNFEDGWTAGCTFRGREHQLDVKAIVAHVNKDALLKIAEKLFHAN